MSITIHQRVHGYLWHWKTGPGWFRNPVELVPLREAGMRVLKVQLQDDGPIPRDLVDGYRNDAGFQVWGMVGHVNDWERDPEGLARWLKEERVRLALTGLDFNFEDEVLGFDIRSGGKWSVRFCTEARRLMPTLNFHLDSYWGPMGAGINLGAYKDIGCRFAVQTFWGAEGLWDDPTTNIVRKGEGAQPVIDKSLIKPIIRITKNNSGQTIVPATVIGDTQVAGTKGIGLYYIDGIGDFATLCLLPSAAINAGLAY